MPLSAAPPSIISTLVTLRPVQAEDLPGLLAINRDPEVTRHLGHAPWTSLTDAERWFGRITGLVLMGSALECVILATGTDTVIGRCSLFEFEETNAYAGLGYVLGRPYWGKGLMHEALSALLDCAFGPIGLRRIEARVEAGNLASTRLLHRLGFTHEGTLRARWMNPDGPIDAEVYGLLQSEWPIGAARLPRTGAGPA